MLRHWVNSGTPSQGSVLRLERALCRACIYTKGGVRWCDHTSLRLESPSWAVPAPWDFSPAAPWSYRILSVSLGASSGTVTLLHISHCVASYTGTFQTRSELCSQLELSIKEMESELQTVHYKGTGQTGGCISIRKGGQTASFQSSEESEKLRVIAGKLLWPLTEDRAALRSLLLEEGLPMGQNTIAKGAQCLPCVCPFVQV